MPALKKKKNPKKKISKKKSRRQLSDRRTPVRQRGAVRRREEMTVLPSAKGVSAEQSSIAAVLALPKRLYNWVLGFAQSPHSERALFTLSFAESSFFPVPPDVLLMPLVLGKPSKWVRFAAYCTLASVLGGMLGFLIGYSVWAGMADTVFAWHLPSINPYNFEKVAAMFSEYGMWFILAAAFTPLPYKVITITAGSMAVSGQIAALPFFAMFVAVSILGRGARFFLVAFFCKRFGPPILPLIDKYFGWLSLIFVALLMGGFYVLKMMH